MPASSPLCSLIISYLNFFLSNHFRYILLNISAQSWLSVPPAPACISRKTSSPSSSPDKKHLISNCFTSINSLNIFFSQSSSIDWSDSSKASLLRSLRLLTSFSVLLKKLKIFSKKFFSFVTFLEFLLSFQKSFFKISLFRLTIFSLILLPSKIPPDIRERFFG